MIWYALLIIILIVLLALLIWWFRRKTRVPRIGVAVCTRPDFERATYVGGLALRHVVDEWIDRGFEISDLNGDSAVRARVLDALARVDPVFFFGCGHGNKSTFTGQGYDKIFWTCDCRELSGRVVYLLSCITGAELGPDMVNDKGAWCFIGYSETFGWIMERAQDPLVDRYARGFFEAALAVIRRLMAGASTAEAYRASIDVWNYWIDHWSRSADPNAAWVLQWLIHDRDYQRLIGDETATVAAAIPPPWNLLALTLGMAPMGIVIGTIGTQETVKVVPEEWLPK